MYIKQLEMKRTGQWDKIVKIGETEHYSRKEKDKPIQLKIGHGSASTLNPIKY